MVIAQADRRGVGMRQETIQVECIRFAYRKSREPVFKDYSVEFGSGITLLKGFSGCGKSTLLRLIAGYLKLNSGAIHLPDCDFEGLGASARSSLGFVFQGINLFPEATVRRNIELAITLSGRRFKDYEAAYRLCLSLLGLEGLEDVRCDQLSGGQRQRAAFARAVVKEPMILCLDEPTSGLDDMNTTVLKRYLLNYSKGGKRYILIATHDDRLVSIADQIVDFDHRLVGESGIKALVD